MALTVSCERPCGCELPGQVAGLLLAAADCGLGSITLYGTDAAPRGAAGGIEALVEANPLLVAAAGKVEETPVDEFGYLVVSRGDRFLLLRDEENDRRYSIFIPATAEAACLAARIAYLVAVIMGFPAAKVLDVRSGVNELLANIVEHGGRGAGDTWIQTTLERAGESLCVSIVDKGIEFDPRAGIEPGGEEFSSGRGKFGPAMLGRIHHSFRYERKNGYNRVYFNRRMSHGGEHAREKDMAGFEIGEPRRLSHGAGLIELRGDLDARGALAVETLRSALLERRLLNIVLDFSRVALISSAGVGALLGMVSEIRAEGGEIRLTGVGAEVRSLLNQLNLEGYFRLMDPGEATA